MRYKSYKDVSRVQCVRCRERASAQWFLNPCAIGRKAWYALCEAHDIELNKLVMDFLLVPDREALLSRYIKGENDG